MKRAKHIIAAVVALLLILTSLTAVGVFAEGEEAPGEESSSAVETGSSTEEESSSSEEEKSSSSAEEKSSSSEEEKSSSSVEEEKSSSSEEEQSSAEERKTSPSSSSSEEEVYAQTITHDLTGISIGLSQPNEKLLIDAKAITGDDAEYAEIYEKLTAASKDKGLVCCYEVILGGDESFNSKVTVILPVDETLIGRSMVVLFYPERASRVETSNKDVVKTGSPSSSAEGEAEAPASGIIKVSETLEAGRKYYFAVCEVADFVPASGGFGLLEIMAILVGAAALASGGLLAFLWVRYNKKQQSGQPGGKSGN